MWACPLIHHKYLNPGRNTILMKNCSLSNKSKKQQTIGYKTYQVNKISLNDSSNLVKERGEEEKSDYSVKGQA